MAGIRLSAAGDGLYTDTKFGDWQEGSQSSQVAALSDVEGGLTLTQFEKWHEEIRSQPAWRRDADRESDYCDGNQLDSEVLRKQQSIGMPPAIEPLIGPVIDSVLGMEAQHRTNWKVIPDDVDDASSEVAEALNHKLNTAEKQSKADKACSAGFAGQAKVGVGIVEVSREDNPFKYPYRANEVPRNEVFWDWRAKCADLSDARYLVRRKWTDREQAKLLFPQHEQLIDLASNGWSGIETNMSIDGGRSTGLAMRGDGPPAAYGAVATPLPGQSATSVAMLSASYSSERGSSLEEQEWRDTSNSRTCLFEVWYRVWVRVLTMKLPDGRVVEYDHSNDMHSTMVGMGVIKPVYSIISKVHLAWFLGPHKLSDEPTPYRHNKFPYVFFWGKKEDRTGVPFGLIRGMMYLQDNINATTSKIRWGLSAVRTERTDGATLDDDDTVRNEVSRPDADIVLVKDFTEKKHVFKVTRDFQLDEQQYKMLTDSREGIKRVGGVYNAFMGENSNANSGVAITNLTEQSTQSLADLYDNFRTARAEVGELLLSLIVEDMIGSPQNVTIKGNALKEDKVIQLNTPATDDVTGMAYLTNDIERTMLKVDMEEVPSTPSFKSQQLNSFSEVFKAAPPEFQRALFPQLLSLMDTPNRMDAIKAVQEAMNQPTPEQVQQKIDEAVQNALTKAMIDLKGRELDLKEQLNIASIKQMIADAVKTGTEAVYASMQAGQVIATIPAVAPIADKIMQIAGYVPPTPGGQDPNFPQPAAATTDITDKPVFNPNPGNGNVLPAVAAKQNTDPELPPISPMPKSPGIGARRGIETARTSDNLNQ